jgi:hypothetical protein
MLSYPVTGCQQERKQPTPSKNVHNTFIALPEKTWKQVAREAKRDRVSISAFIRTLIDTELARRKMLNDYHKQTKEIRNAQD